MSGEHAVSCKCGEVIVFECEFAVDAPPPPVCPKCAERLNDPEACECKAPPPPERGRMSDEEFERRIKLVATDHANTTGNCVIVADEARRARESEAEGDEGIRLQREEIARLNEALAAKDAEIERLRAALEPLAALAPHYDDDSRFGIVVVCEGEKKIRLTGHDAHIAREALAGGKP